MTALIPLHFDHADVRMVMRDGEPWWVGIDVVSALGISKAHQALSSLEDYERGTYIVGTPSGRQEMVVINESGIYSLIFRSRKPSAVRFKRWLTCDVLPSIRKFGSYPPPDIAPMLIVDTEGPWDGREMTIGQRFREERLRWEAEMGMPLAKAYSMSKNIIRAIEDDMGGMKNKNRIEYLTYAGIDVLYVMTGAKTLTVGERALRNAYRMASPEERSAWLSKARAISLSADDEPLMLDD